VLRVNGREFDEPCEASAKGSEGRAKVDAESLGVGWMLGLGRELVGARK